METTKDFDCVKMMRDIRDKVNAEIVQMDSAQVVAYFNKKSEEYETLMSISSPKKASAGADV